VRSSESPPDRDTDRGFRRGHQHCAERRAAHAITKRPANRIGDAYLADAASSPNVLNRVHQRQLLTALIAVSYMRVEELGFLVGEVVL